MTAIRNREGCGLFSALMARATDTSIVITNAWIAMLITLTPPPTRNCRNMSFANTRCTFFKQLQPHSAHRKLEIGETCDVAFRPREACNKASRYRIGNLHKHNRYG